MLFKKINKTGITIGGTEITNLSNLQTHKCKVYEVITQHGWHIYVSNDKSLVTCDDNGNLVSAEAKPGIFIARLFIPIMPRNFVYVRQGMSLDYDYGYMMGSNLIIPDWWFTTPTDFKEGLIEGYLHTKSHIITQYHEAYKLAVIGLCCRKFWVDVAVLNDADNTIFFVTTLPRRKFYCPPTSQYKGLGYIHGLIQEPNIKKLGNMYAWDKIILVRETPLNIAYDTTTGNKMFLSSDGFMVYDTMMVHVPISHEAVFEATKLLPSRNILSPANKSLMIKPSQELLMGLYLMTKDAPRGRAKPISPTLKYSDTVSVDGKRTTYGRYLLNRILPPELRDYKAVWDGKYVDNLLKKVYEKYPTRYAQIIQELMNLSREAVTKESFSFDIKDVYPEDFIKWKRKVLKQFKKPDVKKAIQIGKKIEEKASKMDNAFTTMVKSRARGKSMNLRQIFGAPLLMKDIDGKIIPTPVKRSYTEGLTLPEYLVAARASRRTIVDKVLGVSEPGALTKEMISSAVNLVIVERDCKTNEGIEMEIDDPEIIDRCILKGIPGVIDKNDVITPQAVSIMKSRGIKKIVVRSPLTCKSIGGICQLCYGLDENGEFPPIGSKVGVKAAQTISEPTTQFTLKAKHYAGAIGEVAGKTAAFTTVKRLFEMPETLPGAGILAPHGGKIEDIMEDKGIYKIKISGKWVKIPPGRKVTVKVGQTINKGDVIAIPKGLTVDDTLFKPQDIANLKGIREAQKYVVNTAQKIYHQNGIYVNRKPFEVVTKALTRFARIIDPADSEWNVNDIVDIAAVEKYNETHKKKVVYEPVVKGLLSAPLQSEDWLYRMSFRRLKQTLTSGVARAYWSDVATIKSPLSAWAYGVYLGREKERREKR